MSPNAFNTLLRKVAISFGIPPEMALLLSSHVFRRSMAMELVRSHSPLATNLEAGSWRFNAFMEYCQKHVEEEAVVACIIDHSDTDDDDSLLRGSSVVPPGPKGHGKASGKAKAQPQSNNLHSYLSNSRTA